ncbi:MAG: ABC transporter permease subunit [Ardenticatenales bacterium]
MIALIARKEVRDALRNRWFMLYAAAFALLAIGLSQLSLGDGGTVGYAGFGRTAAGLVNLVLLVVPLIALTLGAQSIAGERERGTLATLLAQPVTRAEVLIGKYVGLALALGAALLLGFGLAGAWVAARGGGVEALAYGQVIVAALLLALAMLAVGFVVSAAARRTGGATAVALFIWLGLVFAGDLGLMGTSVTMRMPVSVLLALTLINPLEAYRIGAVASITGSLDVLGPAGVYADRTFGAGLVAVLAGVIVVWTVVSLGAAVMIFNRRGIR